MDAFTASSLSKSSKYRMVRLSPSFSSIFGAQASKVIGLRNIRPALSWIILRPWAVDDTRARASQLDHQGGQFQDGEFCGVAQIDGTDHLVRRVHEPHQAIDKIINVTE
jgi:hypothetical protein